MDPITQLPSRIARLRIRDVSSRINQRSDSDNLLIYKGLIDKKRPADIYITEHNYFLLNQRYVAKLHHEPGIKDAFYEFTVFDLWSEKEM
jgi:hypothetical protein